MPLHLFFFKIMIKRYSDKEIDFLKNNYQNIGNKKLGELIGRSSDSVKHQLQRFGLKRTPEEVSKLRKQNNSGQFKKGSKPHNTKHNGYERITKDGYVEVRISKGVFKLKHRLVWEEYFGKIPEGYIVCFKSGSPTNFDINDLELISRSEQVLRNQNRKKAAKSLKKKWDVYWHLNQLGIRKSWYATNHIKKRNKSIKS